MYDANSLFSSDYTLAQAAASYLSDAYDTWQGFSAAVQTPPIGGPLINDLGRTEVELFCQLTETFTSGGAATVDFQFVQADDSALGTNLAVVASTGALAKALLVAGYQPALPPRIPPGRVTQRWVGMRYVIATAAGTAGKVTAGLDFDRQTNVNVI